MELRLLPVRCFSCNKILQRGWEEFRSRTREGASAEGALDEAGFSRLCCRRMVLTQPIPLESEAIPSPDASRAGVEDPKPLRTAKKMSRKASKTPMASSQRQDAPASCP